MYDEIMYVWAVKDSDDRIYAICRSEDTAEYLRDWIEAIVVNEWVDTFKKFADRDCLFKALVIASARKYSVVEEEVIL